MPGYNLHNAPYGVEWRFVLAGAAIFTAGMVCRGLLSGERTPQIIRSPRSQLLPKLSTKEKDELPYPPDALPGARDVETPYGTIRAYEFGPEDGRKVLLVHGISTPCISLGAVANGLVDKGCRVLLFDLFGRGYSDTSNDVRQDIRLFTSQILLVLASSQLPWTGSTSFSIIGYSLGGGIAAAFTSYFPDLVSSLVLIAPSGLLRPHHISRKSRILYQYSDGIVPESILNNAVRRRLKSPIAPTQNQPTTEKTTEQTVIQAEVSMESNSQAPLSKVHPDITIQAAVAHQLDHHEGFVGAFMSSIRHGPIQNQHEYWRRIGQRLSDRNRRSNQKPEKVLIIGGEHDAIIIMDELKEDAAEVLQDNVQFQFINAGHELPITKGEDIVKCIWDFWQ